MIFDRYQCIVSLLAYCALCGAGRASQPGEAGVVTGAAGGLSSPPRQRFRILGVFGHPGKSHFDVFRPLLEELALRGHDITVVSYFPRDKRTLPALPNYRDISLLKDDAEVFVDVVDLNMIHHSPVSVFMELMLLRQWGLETCKAGLANAEVRRLLKSDERFDLILTEGFNSDCFLGFVHRFKAPFVSLSSHQLMPWINQRLANEDNPSYIPAVFNAYGPHMSFRERLVNAFIVPFVKIFYEVAFNGPVQELAAEAFGPDLPPLREIARNTSVVLANTHYSLHGSKPDVPNVVQVGGLHISPISKPLPENIGRFLDEARQGVLYFSLGSMIKASTMPKDKLTTVLNVIGTIPRRVIWKWETEDLPNRPANLLIQKWLPQAAILAHPNVKCFMAHGGLLGVSEGVQAGVPMVIIPMYGDQFHNAAAARSRGVAEVLEWNDLDEKTLRAALDRVFNDTSYEVNARALSKAYRDRPETPLEAAVWWTEYVARGNGNPYLKSAANDLSVYQYYLLDVIAVVAGVVLLAIYITLRLIRLFISMLCRRRTIGQANGNIPSRKKTTKRE